MRLLAIHSIRAVAMGPLPKKAVAKAGSVAIIPIVGGLSKGAWFGADTLDIRRQVRAAAADSQTSGILLAIDSPGGEVAGIEALAADIRAARKVKPVWAQLDDLGASAAYWLAASAGRVVASTRSTLVGSIGTYVVTMDMSEAAHNEGIKVHVVATGPLKGMGVLGTPITDEQLGYLGKIVEQTQSLFDRAVKTGRRMTDAQLGQVKTGGVWLAEEAQALKLIDGIQPIEVTLSQLSKAG